MNTDRMTEARIIADELNLAPVTPNLNRISRAIDLAGTGTIKPAKTAKVMPGMRVFEVTSATAKDTIYTVEIYDQFRSTCTCPDPNVHCKHVIAVRIIERREAESAWEGFSMDDPSITYEWLGIFSQP